MVCSKGQHSSIHLPPRARAVARAALHTNGFMQCHTLVALDDRIFYTISTHTSPIAAALQKGITWSHVKCFPFSVTMCRPFPRTALSEHNVEQLEQVSGFEAANHVRAFPYAYVNHSAARSLAFVLRPYGAIAFRESANAVCNAISGNEREYIGSGCVCIYATTLQQAEQILFRRKSAFSALINGCRAMRNASHSVAFLRSRFPGRRL